MFVITPNVSAGDKFKRDKLKRTREEAGLGGSLDPKASLSTSSSSGKQPVLDLSVAKSNLSSLASKSALDKKLPNGHGVHGNAGGAPMSAAESAGAKPGPKKLSTTECSVTLDKSKVSLRQSCQVYPFLIIGS